MLSVGVKLLFLVVGCCCVLLLLLVVEFACARRCLRCPCSRSLCVD